jgi:spermidine synthase
MLVCTIHITETVVGNSLPAFPDCIYDEVYMSSQLTQRRFLPVLLLLFFGSGCAALIYEIVWLQLLELVIGSSGISLGVLLGVFMGGMCLGSFALPRLISPRYHPLKVYACLEIGIGVIGVLVLWCMPTIAGFYANFYWHGIFSRALIATICLIPPTLLMGATLPAAARFVESSPEGISWMGFFYGGNIAGAVAGCLFAGFFLLRIYNMPVATYAALAINIFVAAIAFGVARQSSHTPVSDEAAQNSDAMPSYRSWVYLAIALSGLSALGAEVVWTRLLSLLMGGTVYSFSIILAVFLIGMGIGSGAGSMMARIVSRPRVVLGIFQLCLAGAIAWAAFVISQSLPYWPINPGIATNDWAPWHIFQLDLLRAAWMVLPAAFLWGASFPMAIAAVASKGQDPGRMVGAVYAANTVGAILGSLGFSLLIIPQFGTQWAERFLMIVAAISAVVALTSFILSEYRKRTNGVPAPGLSFFGTTVAAIALLLVVFMAASVAKIPWVMIAWGRYSATYVANSAPEINGSLKKADESGSYQWRCKYVGEGMNVSVAVTENAAGARFFHGAGKVQASSQAEDMRLQRMLGHLSALTCKDPEKVEDVLVVACGAGVTAGSFMVYPNVKRIVICDIEPLVPKVVTPMFGNENYHIVDGIAQQNPHIVNGKEVKVVYDDGRHYINTLPPDAKFDVITSDPIDPWVKGSAALNTIEYYEMCKRHLKPGGVMSLWMPLYESKDASAKSLIATFFKVFPQGMLFSNDQNHEGYDAVLLGQAESSKIDVDRLQSLLDRNDYFPVTQSLTEVGFAPKDAIQSFAGRGIAVNLLATFAAQAPALKPWTQNAQINHDKDLRLQYLAGMYFNSYESTKILQNILSCYQFPKDVVVGSNETMVMLRIALAESGRKEK